ncbi:MAG: sulfite exporter TauE/SafE family protein [Oscillospiraceae bacterium]|jgi:uncharacterized membrane protein YfcA|nr:sulfite exporter TauE/SafE family protein [Oscillospiraceae bacterium]
MKKFLILLAGFFAGTVNGLLGAGSGNIIVPMLERHGVHERRAHATSVFVVFFFCVSSAILYFSSGRIILSEALPYALWGTVGAFLGSNVLSKINQKILRRVFSIFLITSGIRMFLK